MNARPTDRFPPLALVAAGAVSVQFGAALATKLFNRVGPVGATSLRVVIGALVLAPALMAHRTGRQRRGELLVPVAFGLILVAMNLTFYEAIARIPLGVAVTVEFTGPLVLALIGSRHLLDGVWAVLAGGGVALLGSDVGHGIDAGGLGLALLAGAFWIGYILLAKQTGRRFDALTGLAIAMSVGAVVILPAGLVAAGGSLFTPSVLGLGAAVAVLSSAVPYGLELIALRRVDPRAFGVMLSVDPALATAAGFLVLGQHLTPREWIALGLVVAANLGNSLTGAGPVEVQDPGSSVAA